MVRSYDEKNRLHIGIARDFFLANRIRTFKWILASKLLHILKAKNQQDPLESLNFGYKDNNC